MTVHFGNTYGFWAPLKPREREQLQAKLAPLVDSGLIDINVDSIGKVGITTPKHPQSTKDSKPEEGGEVDRRIVKVLNEEKLGFYTIYG